MTLTEQELRKAIGEIVIDFDTAGLDPDTDFIDAGMDSLDLADILLSIEESHGLQVPDDDLEHCRSIRGVLDYAARSLGS